MANSLADRLVERRDSLAQGGVGGWWRRWVLGPLAFWALVTGAIAPVAQGAERVYVVFGPVGASVSIAAISHFAETGEATEEMSFYARSLTPPDLAQLRAVLTARANLSVVGVSQFLYSPQGEVLLGQLAQAIQTKSGAASEMALRAALVMAAGDAEGLTLLNVLRRYPTQELRLDLRRALGILRDVKGAVADRVAAVAAVQEAARAERERQPWGDRPGVDLSLPGPFAVGRSHLVVNPDLPGNFELAETRDPATDPGEGQGEGQGEGPARAGAMPALAAGRTVNGFPAPRRSFPVDLYWPRHATGRRAIALISHGLGSNRETYRYLAEHLASYGYVAVLPQHTGSDQRFLEALLHGQAAEIADPQEFLDRPTDARDLLDTLAREGIRDPAFSGSLDLERVAGIGQSFGAYTVLALAGAELNFVELARACSRARAPQNPSLLLQCRALVVRPDAGVDRLSFRDPRLKAVLAINPIVSGLFGDRGLSSLQIPVAIVSGTDDPIAPALPEQIAPFATLDRPDKLLALLEGGTHFSTLGPTGEETFQLPEWAVGPRTDLARKYLKSLATAFLGRYLNHNLAEDPLLSAAWAQKLSQPELPLTIIHAIDPALLAPQTVRRELVPQPYNKRR